MTITKEFEEKCDTFDVYPPLLLGLNHKFYLYSKCINCHGGIMGVSCGCYGGVMGLVDMVEMVALDFHLSVSALNLLVRANSQVLS